jgi:hypothetical protein
MCTTHVYTRGTKFTPGWIRNTQQQRAEPHPQPPHPSAVEGKEFPFASNDELDDL